MRALGVCFLHSLIGWITLFFIATIRSMIPQDNPKIDLTPYFGVVRVALNQALLELLSLYGVLILTYALLFYAWDGLFKRSLTRTKWGLRSIHFGFLGLSLSLFFAFLCVYHPALVDDFMRYGGIVFPPSVLDLFAFHVPLSLMRSLEWILFAVLPIIGLGVKAYRLRRNVFLPVLLSMGGILTALWVMTIPLFHNPSNKNFVKNKKNLMIICLDSLRPDRIGELTPHLSQFKTESVAFQRMITPIPRTAPSWISLLTGTYPSEHGITHMFPSPGDRKLKVKTLFHHWKENGGVNYIVSDYAGEFFDLFNFPLEYRDFPEGFSLNSLVSRHILYRHFAALTAFNLFPAQNLISTLQFLPINSNSDWVTHRIQSAWKRAMAQSKPVLMVVNYSAVHSPGTILYPHTRWNHDPSYQGPNKYAYAIRDLEDLDKHGSDYFNEKDKLEAVKLYDRSVKATDQSLGKLFDFMKKSQLWDNTEIIIISDHGETLFERGHPLIHGAVFDGGEQDIKTTFMWKPLVDENPPKPQEVEALTRFIDFMPTLWPRFFRESTRKPKFEGIDLFAKVNRSDDLIIPPLEIYLENGVVFNSKVDFKFAGAESYPLVLELLEAEKQFPGYIYLRKENDELIARTKWRMMMNSKGEKVIYFPTKTGGKFKWVLKPGEWRGVDEKHPNEIELKAKLIDFTLRDKRLEFSRNKQFHFKKTFPHKKSVEKK